MGKHLGYLIAAANTGPSGIVFLVFSFVFRLLFSSPTFPPEMAPLVNYMVFGFFLAGLILAIAGGVLLLIGIVKYRNRDAAYTKY